MSDFFFTISPHHTLPLPTAIFLADEHTVDDNKHKCTSTIIYPLPHTPGMFESVIVVVFYAKIY